MYDIVKEVILSSDYILKEMLRKIDTLWIKGEFTDEQKTELINLAKEHADFTAELNIIKEIEDLKKRVSKLEDADVSYPEEYPEYVSGKWYYKNDKITFEGKKYICIAQDGIVCVWNPNEYPEYWKLVG